MQRVARGFAAALRARLRVALGVALVVAAFDLAAPVLLLSLAKKPVDFFTFNPWLRRLPDYVVSPEPLAAKLSYLSGLTIAWASADAPEGIAWGFIVDVPTLLRVALTAAIFGAYFALWSYERSAPGAARPAGVLGVATTVFGLTTGPCTLAGCGAPVLPVVALAFTGAPATMLALFATLSRVGAAAVLLLMTAAAVWTAWRAGSVRPPA